MTSSDVDRQRAAGSDGVVPAVSILIPVFNEEGILAKSVEDLVSGCDTLSIEYEILLCENGSVDTTPEIIRDLRASHGRVQSISYPEPNYGGALKAGIEAARGEVIICFEIDFYDIQFVEISTVLLKKYDAVVGSKRAPGSRDRRPWIRRFITWGFNSSLSVIFGFRGTDTHGIKSFRASVGKPIAAACETDRDIFTTELIIRMERAGLRMCEIPLEIEELRPAPIRILKRVPGTLKNLVRLRGALRGLKRAPYPPDRMRFPHDSGA
jgi:glycosyltransferase involved in cell wall biosynthesis